MNESVTINFSVFRLDPNYYEKMCMDWGASKNFLVYYLVRTNELRVKVTEFYSKRSEQLCEFGQGIIIGLRETKTLFREICNMIGRYFKLEMTEPQCKGNYVV